jgi:penicillin-binding protein 1C
VSERKRLGAPASQPAAVSASSLTSPLHGAATAGTGSNASHPLPVRGGARFSGDPSGGARDGSAPPARGRRAKAFTLAIAIVILALGIWIRCGPLPPGFLDPVPHRSTLIVDRNGNPLYESLSATEQRSHWITADEIPPAVAAATLAAEDHRFFRHPGVDPIAITRALVRAAIARRFVEGGSTLTQQTVKQILIAHGDAGARRTPRTKIRETVLALRLEHRLDKHEILALYLNLAPYGNQYVGIDRASHGYFEAPPGNLTHAQAAFLAGLPRKPSALDPWRNRTAALERQRRVMRRMEETGLIDGEQAKQAREERLELRRPSRELLARHFVERVLEQPGATGASRIETTLDLPLQRDILGIVDRHARALQKYGAHNLGIVVLDNRSGEWLAWVGSPDYFDSDHGGAIDAVTSPRQPGSALKPFTYALAFESGFTPATVLPDVEIDFPTAEEGVRYKPRNYDGIYRGPLRARVALAGSENVPAVWLLSQIGTRTLLSGMRSSAFTTLDRDPDHYGLGLTLGDAEVRLDELVRAYAMFARGGVPVETRKIRRIAPEREVVAEHESAERMISERSAFWVTDILADPRAREYIFGSGGPLDFPFEVAVKTGTSQAYRDNWTVGYTRELTVGVWIGNLDRRPLRNSSGVTGAAPIFHDVMLAAVKRRLGRVPVGEDRPIAIPPESLERREICALSGDQPSTFCMIREREWIDRSMPRPICSWHESDGTQWPGEYRAWAKATGRLPARSELASTIVVDGSHPSPLVARRSPLAARTLRITNPGAGATYWIDPTLRPEFQTLALRATILGSGPGEIVWSIGDETAGTVHSDDPLDWALRRGTHQITVRDAAGNEDSVRITVK